MNHKVPEGLDETQEIEFHCCANAGFLDEDGRLHQKLDRHPQHIKVGKVDDLAIKIEFPVAGNDVRQEQARDQEKIRHAEGGCKGDDHMHPACLASGGFHAEHRMHHHDEDDADALGGIHPIYTAGAHSTAACSASVRFRVQFRADITLTGKLYAYTSSHVLVSVWEIRASRCPSHPARG